MNLTRLLLTLGVAGVAVNHYLKTRRPDGASGGNLQPSGGMPSSAAAGESEPFGLAAVNPGAESPNAAERQPAQGLAGAMEGDAETARAGTPGSAEFLQGA